jgi:hypothetical protein
VTLAAKLIVIYDFVYLLLSPFLPRNLSWKNFQFKRKFQKNRFHFNIFCTKEFKGDIKIATDQLTRITLKTSSKIIFPNITLKSSNKNHLAGKNYELIIQRKKILYIFMICPSKSINFQLSTETRNMISNNNNVLLYKFSMFIKPPFK